MANQPLFLKVFRSGQLYCNKQFFADQISIGSSQDGPSLVLSDPSVCYWHTLIEKRGAGYYISDLGSPTGTFVNGHKILEAPLNHGDQITIGNFNIQFYINVPFARTGPEQPSKSSDNQTISEKSDEKTEEMAPPPAVKESSLSSENAAPTFSLDVESEKKVSQETVFPVQPSKFVQDDKDVEPSQPSSSFQAPAQSDEAVQATGAESIPDDMPSFQDLPDPSMEQKELRPADFGTYAPPSSIKDLDKNLSLGSGPIVEVIVAWKERILNMSHFYKEKEVSFGSDSTASICLPNLLGITKYPLLEINTSVNIGVSDGVQVTAFNKQGKYSLKQLMSKGLVNVQGGVTLQQKQLIKLEFGNCLSVYVRFVNRVQTALTGSLFNFSASEMTGIMMSCFFMCILVFYIGLFSPQFLDPKEDLEEEGIRKVTIEFNKKRRPPVRLKMTRKANKKKEFSVPIKKAPKKKITGIKKPGKAGKLAQVAPKPKAKSKKKTITSARPGGSVKTKKAGAPPRPPRPDPTKMGLLGVFGSKGTQTVLDKAYSGTGELAGLVDQATGFAGQKDSYKGDGIGTKFKNAGAGGTGTALLGASAGIKTKGRGGGGRGTGRGGSLGSKGSVQLEVGVSDLDVDGGIDRDAILRVIRRHKYTLESCISTARQNNPDISGTVLVGWDILNERVKKVRAKKNTSGNAVLARCIMSKIRNMRFTGTGLQKGQIGAVSVPFVF